MLTKNSVKKLFTQKNPHTCTIIFHPAEDLSTFENKIGWLETIKCALGEKIINNSDLEFIDVVSIGGYRMNRFATGKQLIELISSSFDAPISLRISFPSWPTRSWIILIHQDAELL